MTTESDVHGLIMPRSQELIDYAYRYARDAHGDQKRKYTGEPYINHPVSVANIVMTTNPDCEMVCAALMHDLIEDTDETFESIRDAGFREGIARLVVELSDVSKPEDGNRATRKAIDREHLSTISDRAKTIKLADLIDNSSSITEYDPDFSKVYMKEKSLLLPVLKGGDSVLMSRANEIVNDYYK